MYYLVKVSYFKHFKQLTLKNQIHQTVLRRLQTCQCSTTLNLNKNKYLFSVFETDNPEFPTLIVHAEKAGVFLSFHAGFSSKVKCTPKVGD